MNNKEKEALRLKKKRRNQLFGVAAILTMAVPTVLSTVVAIQNGLKPAPALTQTEQPAEEQPADSVVRLKDGEPVSVEKSESVEDAGNTTSQPEEANQNKEGSEEEGS